MFDLRVAVVTAIQDIAETYIGDAVFDNDPHSTQGAIEQMEKCVFDEAAVILGDLRQPQERLSFGFNSVKNELELLVCAKGKDAKANFNNILNNLKLGLDNNKFDQTLCFSTKLSLVGKQEKYLDKDRIYYQIVTLEVGAWEASAQLTGDDQIVNPPSVTITSPAEGHNYNIVGAASVDVTLNINYTIGTFPASYAYFILTPGLLAGAKSAPAMQSELLSGGSASVTWAVTSAKLAISSTGVYNYELYVILIDQGQVCATDMHSITFTVT